MKPAVRLLCLATFAVVAATVHAQESGQSVPDLKPAVSNPAPPSLEPPVSVPDTPPATPKGSPENNTPSPAPEAQTPGTIKSAIDALKAAAADPRNVFAKPAPTNATQDPAVIAALESTRSIERMLSVIHERFKSINDSYEKRASTNKDLKTVSEEMKPLVKAARTDVANVMQSAQDLIAELPHTKLSLESAALLFRQRAITYRDPELRKVTESMADELERLEQDVPRRMRLTADFILQLTDLHSFLAETDRCLHDTAAAMSILSAGADQPKASTQGVAFRIRIKQYMAAMDEYRKKLTEIPPAQSEEQEEESGAKNPGGSPKPAKTGESNVASSGKPAKDEAVNPPGYKPIDPRAAETAKVRDVLQPGTTFAGQYHDPQGLFPLQVSVRKRQGNRISGDIYTKTRYGLGHQRFTGFVTGSDFSLHVTYVSGPLVQTPETWQGRLNTEKIDGVWISNNTEGRFGLNYGTPVVTNR